MQHKRKSCALTHGPSSVRCKSREPNVGSRRGKGSLLRLVDDDRGSMFTEYLVVLVFVAFGASSAVLYCAYVVAGNFVFVRNYALFPFP